MDLRIIAEKLGEAGGVIKDRGLLGIVLWGAGLFSLQGFFALFLFPLLVQGALLIGEHGVDLSVGVLLDGAAGAVIGSAVVGGIFSDAVHGDVPVDEDDLELKDLILRELEPFFHCFELTGRAFGSRAFWTGLGQGGILGLGLGFEGCQG